MSIGAEARAYGDEHHDKFVDQAVQLAIQAAIAPVAQQRDDALGSLATTQAQLLASQADYMTLRAEFDAHMATHVPPEPAFQLGAQFHAVWDRLGSAFGSIHVDILTKLKAAGVKVVRIDTSWVAWEPTRGVFPASIYNGKLRDTLDWLKNNDMQALVTIYESPSWATSTQTARKLPDTPSSCEGIGRYSTEYLSFWGDTVVGVEFWNEPNLTAFEQGGPRPAHYAECLKSFYKGAKAGTGKTVPVVFGATEAICVAPQNVASSKPREHFISYVYDHLGLSPKPWDIMAVHFYPSNESYDVVSNGTHFWRLRHLDFLFAEMDAAGDDSDVFITEFGWSTHSNSQIGSTASPPWQLGVTEAQQASFTTGALDLIQELYPRVKLAVLYNDWERGDVNVASYTDRHTNGFGLLRLSARATSKPIYAALTAYNQE